jgi:hypothetical protein
MTLSIPQPKTSNRKLSKEDLKTMREKDLKMVKGIFRSFEPRGGQITFCYKKYKEDPLMNFTMKDGETYEVPYMVARHLNTKCAYPKHSNVLDSNGNPSVCVGEYVKRCSFESLEFMHDVSLSN